MRCELKGLALGCASIVCVLLAAPTEGQVPPAAASRVKAPQVDAYGGLPLRFEPNQGQTSPEVKFLARGPGYGLFLTGSEMVLALRQPPAGSPSKGSTGKEGVLRMSLAGANAKPEVVGERQLPGRSNYFSGKDPAKWRRNVPQFAGVRYRSVYQGVDLVYYGNQRQLEYDFVVAPRADPRAIRLRFDGASSLRVTSSGDLMIEAGSGEVTVRAPVMYQEVNGTKQPVAGSFVLRSRRDVGFDIGRYDRTRTLIIDPTVVYSTYLGGSDWEDAIGALDPAGNVYLAGMSTSPDFPVTGRLTEPGPPWIAQAFVAKLSTDGRSLVYSTFIDLGGLPFHAISVDPLGHAYAVGMTLSRDLPAVNAVQPTCPTAPGYIGQDYVDYCTSAYVLKLSPTGDSLIYSTYLGGTEADWYQARSLRIATDISGSTYLAGSTLSPTFPIANPLQGSPSGGTDAVVVKLDPQGGWVYSTYLGGNNRDAASNVAADAQGNAYVVGGTRSADFPTVNAVQAIYAGGVDYAGQPASDGFVAKLSPDGAALVYSTYLGGSGDDHLSSVVANSGGTAWVTGLSGSSDFPTAPGRPSPCLPGGGDCLNPGLLVKLDAAGGLVYSTGVHVWNPLLAVDSAENVYLAGPSQPFSATLVNPLMTDGPLMRPNRVVIEKLDPTATTVVFSTFWGSGTVGRAIDDGAEIYFVPMGEQLRSLGLDGVGNIYLVGFTTSDDFPTLDAIQPTPGGATTNPYSRIEYLNTDIFVAKIAQENNTRPGQQVEVAPADGATILFDGVTSPGTTSFSTTQLAHPSPDAFRVGDPPASFEISTTASFTGGITVCLDYSKVTFSVEWGLGLYHYENGAWVNITTSVDAANNRICGAATSLSPFAIFGAPLPPVSVAGFAPPLAPLAAEGTAVSWPEKAFKFGRTLPLKLQLLVNGSPLTDQEVKAPKIVEISRQGDSVLNLATLDLNTGASNDNGLAFRFSDGSWVYNLNTQPLSTGRYLITIELWDGRRFQGGFELKR